jgi:hypothetical protein
VVSRTILRCSLPVLILLALVVARGAQLSNSDLEQQSERIQALLRAGKFDEAEPLARECLRQLPEEIYLPGQLETILNGQGKFSRG